MAAAGLVAILFFANFFGEFSRIAAAAKCTQAGRDYNPGQWIKKDCNKCYCLQDGNWVCTERICTMSAIKGVQLTPRSRISIKKDSRILLVCKSERKTSRFTWFVNGNTITSTYKVTTDGKSGESVLLLTSRDFSGEFAYITCYVPPFTPKRVKVSLIKATELPTGFPVFSSKQQVIGSRPGEKVTLECKVDGHAPKTTTWFNFHSPVGRNSSHSTISADGSLTILRAVKSDTGQYYCMVVNDVGASLSPYPVKLVVNSEIKASKQVNGGWCEPERRCFTSCVGGTQVAKRKCACPRPANGGADCVGSTKVQVQCDFTNCPRDVTISGEVSVGTMRSEDFPRGSCLHVEVMKCQKDRCKVVSTMTTRDITVHKSKSQDNHIGYTLTLKNALGPYKIGSRIQLGHCRDGKSIEEILENDGKDERSMFIQPFTVERNLTQIKRNIKANFVEKRQSLQGVLKLRPSMDAIPAGSCLLVTIWEDIMCHGPQDCAPLMTIKSSSFKYQGSSILYNAMLSKVLDARDYLVEATLYVERCSKSADSRPGDYVTLKKQRIFITETTHDLEIDFTLDIKKPEGRYKDIWVSGTVSLPGYNENDIEARSCLTIIFREIYKCNESEGCRNPYTAEGRAKGVSYAGASQFTYEVKFRNVMGSEFAVDGILNLGWCKDFVKGKRRLRKGDYETLQPFVILLSEHQSQADVPLKMERFPIPVGKKEYLMNGELKLESVTQDMLKNSCFKMILAAERCSSGRKCKKIPFYTKIIDNLAYSPRQTIYFKIKYTQISSMQSVDLFVIFNSGWCSRGVEDSVSVRRADLIGEFAVKSEGDIGTLVLKPQTDIRFIEGPFAKAEVVQDSIIVKGNIILPLNYPGEKIEEPSCLIVTVRETATCKKNEICPDSAIARNIFRSIGLTSKNTIAYELTVSPKLKPNIDYLFEAVLNKGWCSEGATDSKWIQDGDLFNSVGARFKDTEVTAVLQNIVLKVFKDQDKEKAKCILRCPKILDPICANNNRTYNSLCEMKTEACLQNSDLEMVHKGECERCKRNCSRIIEPICARNGKTYDNLCIMNREACTDDIYLTYRHTGICGSVTMKGDVRFPSDDSMPDVPAGSCLIIRTRKSVYCDFPETCPDFELAEVVRRNITVPVDRKIPYEVVMNPRPKSSVYLIEVVLNRGWCSADTFNSQWIRNNDFFNYMEQPFAVRGDEPIFKDVKVRKLTKLEEIEEKAPSGLIDPCKVYKCPFYAKCKVEFGRGRCTCHLVCPDILPKPVCGSDDKTYSSECSMQSESCMLKKLVTVKYTGPCIDKDSMLIRGEVTLDKNEQNLPNGSCLSVSLHESLSCKQAENCSKQPIMRFYVKGLNQLPSDKIPYEATIKPRPKPGSYVLSVVLNRGWCSEGSSEWIRDGDLFLNEGQKLEIGAAGSVHKDVSIIRYYQGIPCSTKDGSKIADGEDVGTNGHGCQGCQCKNGTIVCKPVDCPAVKCDDGHLSIEDGDCCPVCIKKIQCKRDIKPYSVGERFFKRNVDQCETCTCNVTGTFTCSKEACPTPNCRQAFFIGSSCCPVCPSDIKCKDRETGMLFKAGETWLGGEANSCSKCKCIVKPDSSVMGYIECTKPSCPKLTCAKQVFPKGYCCPVCLKENGNGPFKEEDVSYLKALIFNEVVSSEISCSHALTGGIFNEGERWRYGCMNYDCSRVGIRASPVPCPYLTCPKAYQVKRLGECCAACSSECLPKLLCTSDAIILVVPKIFLPHTRATELVFGNGNCVSQGNATHLVLRAGLHDCGTRQKTVDGLYFNYTNLAYTREDENAVISRVRLVKIPVTCALPVQATSLLSRQFKKKNRPTSVVNPVPEDTGPIEAYDIFMKVTDKNGVEKTRGKPIEFDTPERVYIEIDGNGLKENNLTVRADYCYLTPTPGPKSKVNYTVIENGCAVDPTVTFHETTGSGQRFSFRSLVFANPKIPGFYLHCDSVTCPIADVKCRKPCRHRRALEARKHDSELVTRKKKPDHSRVMKLTLHVVVG